MVRRVGVDDDEDQRKAYIEEGVRLGFLLNDVSRLRRILMERTLKPLALTSSQWWVLAFLTRRDGMTQTELAADLDLTKVAIGGLLERMEAADLVQRRADDTDARIRRVFITRNGKRVMDRVHNHIVDVVEQILGPNTHEELTMLVDVLARMKGTLLKLIEEEGKQLKP
jgi:DNA-binding MarR family transcriptional regulator